MDRFRTITVRSLCRSSALVSLVGIGLVAPMAEAADKPDVAVVGLHQAELTDDDQEALAIELAQTITEAGNLQGLLPRQVAGTIRGREQPILDDGLVGTARQRLQSGVDLYNQAQFEAAVGLLEEAIEGIERGFPGHLDVADLWKAHVYLGNAREQTGAGGLATELRTAATLAPYLELDPALFPPDVVEAYRAAVEELRKAPVTLTIQADEPGEAFVDGVAVGPVPAVATQLGAGVHHVIVRGENGRIGYERIDLSPEPLPMSPPPGDGGDTGEGTDTGDGADEGTLLGPAGPQPPRAESVEVAMRPPFLGQGAPSSLQRSDQVASLYRALGTRAADVELVLLGGIDDQSLHMQLYHSPSDSWSRPIEVPYQGSVSDEAVASVGLLLNVVEPDGTLSALADEAVPVDIGTNSALASLLLSPPTPLPLPAGDDDRKKGPKTGLVIGIVAGVVAVAAIGGGVAYLASQQGSDDPTTPTTSPNTPTVTGPVNSGTIVIEF